MEIELFQVDGRKQCKINGEFVPGTIEYKIVSDTNGASEVVLTLRLCPGFTEATIKA